MIPDALSVHGPSNGEREEKSSNWKKKRVTIRGRVLIWLLLKKLDLIYYKTSFYRLSIYKRYKL